MNEPNDLSDTDPPHLWALVVLGAVAGFLLSVFFPLPWFGA